MATPFVMPQLGLDMKEGTVLRWLKQEGEEVTKGEIIAEIETEKATVEIEAPDSGLLRKILVPEGETVPVGQTIAIIGAADEEITEEALAGPPPKSAAPEAASAEASAEPEPAAPKQGAGRAERIRASPRSRRLAEEHGVDLSQVKGTGPGGRIVQEDIQAYIRERQAAPAEQPAAAKPAAGAPVSATPMRQAIARRMTQSKQEIPHFYLTVTVDMTQAAQFRAAINESLDADTKVSVNDLVIAATAKALALHPNYNAWYVDSQLQIKDRINVGVAIALEDGLIAPAILDCGSKDLKQIAAASKDLNQRARSGSLKAHEYSEATFTVSNLGMHNVDSFTAIINPPQVGILALGTVKEQPAVRDGNLVVAQLMNMTLSSDHRAVDGAVGAVFLQEIKGLLEAPWKLLL